MGGRNFRIILPINVPKYNGVEITVKVSRRTQKKCNYACKRYLWSCILAFCSTDLGHIFGNNVGNEFGVLMIVKDPLEPEFAYDIARIHSLMI